MTLWQDHEAAVKADAERARKAEMALTKRALRAVNKVPYRRERLWQYGLAFLAIFTITLIWFVNWMAKQ